jgi:anti-sigma regulatory factor (Ser/Thr protein kinase)
MRQARRFPNESNSVTAARRFVTAILRDEPPELLQTAELLVSELASNCVRHTDSDFEVAVVRDEAEIRIAATDWGAGRPVMRALDPLAASGRGLPIIDMMSRTWGIEAAPPPESGKTVWLTLTAAAPPGNQPLAATREATGSAAR